MAEDTPTFPNIPDHDKAPTADTSGAGTNPSTSALGERVADAGNAAIAGNKPPRKGGWPKGRKRTVPGGPMAPGPGAALPAPDETSPNASGWETGNAVFDSEGASALVDGAIEALNDLAENFQRNAALRFTGDELLAEQAAKSARMSEKVRATVRHGAIACLRKYMVNMQYAPEMTLAIGAGLWALGNAVAYRKLREQGVSLGRVAPPPQRESK